MVKLPSQPVKSSDIGRLDLNAASLGLPPQLLMECAGLQATNKIVERYKLSSKSVVVIFAGTGNNGGDGFVIARHLATRGIKTFVGLLGSARKIRTKEARLNWDLLQRLSLNIKVQELKDSTQVMNFINSIGQIGVVLDAMLGTGVTGKIREPMATAIEAINSLSCPKIAIDVPTGVDPDTGQIFDKAIQEDFRITFHRDKIGLQSRENTWIAPIGTPIEAHIMIGEGDLHSVLKRRKKSAHKGEYGKLLVIGGSSAYSGAPSLAALAGLELGLDLVIVLVPESIASVVRGYSPNLIVRSGQSQDLTPHDFKLAQELSVWADAVVIGPGMGRSEPSREFLEKYFSWMLTQNIPLVIDADGIKQLGELKQQRNLDLKGQPWILTPHRGELDYLISPRSEPKEISLWEKGKFYQDIIQKIGITLLLKGVNDFIYPPLENNTLGFRINQTGCQEMTVGGTGDVLAGITGSFLALHNDPFSSACAAAYLNGKLGETAQNQHGYRIHATDLIAQIRPFLKNKNL